ncbi:hypothetical protein BB561_001364 [Smittium simulii]|uniref:glucan endo-1,3-beta-D-glucosidase n=1 Tax=Smittium simulii TaxID=133385 RepID=A0A2T9YUT9_9FUNG|nr:hypothetical protein BB561_001364 [Smittium simulii]
MFYPTSLFTVFVCLLIFVSAAPLPLNRIQKRQTKFVTVTRRADQASSNPKIPALGIPTMDIPTITTPYLPTSFVPPIVTKSPSPQPSQPPQKTEESALPSNTPTNAPTIPETSQDTSPNYNDSSDSKAESAPSGIFWGLTYSPYNVDGSCPSYDKVVSDMKTISGATSHIRLYSTDCGQLENAVKAITENKLPLDVYAGVWISNGADRAQNEINDIINVAKKYGSSLIKGISIGNEDIFKGTIDESALINSINSARQAFKAAGLGHIPVYTTDTDAKFTQKMADACDLLQVNIYTVFDNNFVSIKASVDSILARVNNLKNIAGNKKIRIGETGFPSDGNSGTQSGNLKDQTEFANSIVCKLRAANVEYFFFEAKDAQWKKTESPLERSFGVYTSDFKQKLDLSKLGKC